MIVFLDIKINQNNTDIYYKDTHTGQYINYRSQTPWKPKTSWIKALYHCAHKICSNKQALDKQISKIKTLMSWNGYPKRVRNSVIKPLNTNKSHSRSADDDDRKKIWLDLPYNGKLGKKLVTSLIKKLKRYFKVNVKIVVKYRTNKLYMFCPTKDRISWNQKANVMYIIQCPGCHNDYVGKTDRNLITRLSEHGKKEDQPMFQHFWSCEEFNCKLNLYSLANIFSDTGTVDHIEHVYNSVIDNCKILESCNNWTILQYLEAYYIKTKSSIINVGIKASKELQLFN